MDRIVQFMTYKRCDVFPITCLNLEKSMPGFELPQGAMYDLT
jgi:hypothetical protein